MAGHHGLRASLHHKLAKLRKSTHGNAQGQTPTPNDHHNSTSTSVQIKKYDGQVVLATADGTKGHNHEHANPSTHNVIVDDNGSEGALIHDDGPDSYPGNILTVPWDSRKDDAIESLTWSMKGLTHGEDYVPNFMATGTPDQRQTEGNVPPYPLLNPPKCAGGGPVVDRSRFSAEVHRFMRKRKSAFAKLQPVTHSVSQHRDCKIYYDDNFCPSVPFSSSLQSRSVYRSHFEFAAPSVLDEEQDEALLSMRSPSNFSSWELEDSGEMCSRSSTVPPSTDSSTVLCHRCGEVFESSRSLVKHTRSQMVCKLQERGDADDIDQDTVARLKSRKKGPEQTEPERWIALYKILFPNDTIIPDPYYRHIDSDVGSLTIAGKLDAYRQHVGQELPNLVRHEFQTATDRELLDKICNRLPALLRSLHPTFRLDHAGPLQQADTSSTRIPAIAALTAPITKEQYPAREMPTALPSLTSTIPKEQSLSPINSMQQDRPFTASVFNSNSSQIQESMDTPATSIHPFDSYMNPEENLLELGFGEFNFNVNTFFGTSDNEACPTSTWNDTYVLQDEFNP
ncbi:hypothetical protein TruAng_008849 [Truncatella angustata]|nr:hypothetical protein TruAng_008849 [Truncatella angustata]